MENKEMQKVTDNFYVNKSLKIGSGNFGVVYKGYCKNRNKVIAVKFICRQKLNQIKNYFREIEVMLDLSKLNHPNIMGFYGYQETVEGLYFFIEFCEGGSLIKVIQNKMQNLKAAKLFKQLLQGMIYIHQQNMVHRDLKPDNILLDENDNLKIADFGLTREIQVNMTKLACTPLYAAPEILLRKPYDSKCDVWSAGLILYNMLTGVEMFKHILSEKQLIQQVNRIMNPDYLVLNQVQNEWKSIIRSMLTYHKEKRLSFVQVLEIFQKQNFQPESSETNEILFKTPICSIYQQSKERDLIKLQQEQCLFEDSKNIKKYVTFFLQKIDFMIKLVWQFTNNSYPYTKNVYKFLLMFLSVSAYICRIRRQLKLIDQGFMMIDNKMYNKQHFAGYEQYQSCFLSIIAEYKQKLTFSINKYEKILAIQIIEKIQKTYMQRTTDKEQIIKFEGLTELIERTKMLSYDSQENYMNIYRKIMNQKGIKFSDQTLLKLQINDLKLYCWIRLIGNFDDAFNDESYKSRYYLMPFLKVINQSPKNKLIKFISKYNQN